MTNVAECLIDQITYVVIWEKKKKNTSQKPSDLTKWLKIIISGID